MQMNTQPSDPSGDSGSTPKNPKIRDAIMAVQASGIDPVAVKVAVATLEALCEADAAKNGGSDSGNGGNAPAKNMNEAADNMGNAMYKGGQNG